MERISRSVIDDDAITPHPDHKSKLRVQLHLNPQPAPKWKEYFLTAVTPNFGRNLSLPLTYRITTFLLEYETTDEHFEDHLKDIDARIEGTNKWYFDEYLPALAASERILQEQKAAKENTIQSVRDKYRGK